MSNKPALETKKYLGQWSTGTETVHESEYEETKLNQTGDYLLSLAFVFLFCFWI